MRLLIIIDDGTPERVAYEIREHILRIDWLWEMLNDAEKDVYRDKEYQGQGTPSHAD
jgi:hypothetical protein